MLHPRGFHTSEASLFPKLRDDFAEFLNGGSLERLGILSPPTCVGLRYGHPVSRLEVFPGSLESMPSRTEVRSPTSSVMRVPDFPETQTYE